MEVVHHKNVFINSETARSGDGQNLSVLFPPEAFSTHHKDEIMRLTLNSFTMRRNFYAINEHNNTFYDGTAVGNISNIYTITPGDYTAAELATEIGTKVSGTCAFNSKTRKFTITKTLTGANFFWSDRDKDTHEILGGTPDKLFDDSNSGYHVSKFPIQLDSISDVYIKTNLQTSNFISKTENNHLGNTDIFARVPLYEGDSTLAKTNVVKWEDSNDLYSIYIPNHQLSNVVFHLRDDKDRPLPMSDEQAAAHNVNFKMTFKFEILRKKETAPPPLLPYVKDQMDRVDLRTDTTRFR